MRILVFLSSLLLVACNQSAISKKLSDSDSLVINFNVSGTDAISKTVSATEKSAIRKLIGFMNGKPTGEFKCGYDGNMLFYSNGKELLPVVFKYKEDSCRHFLFELDGKVMSTSMNNEAADFLESLKTGKGSY
jgi:hypothetical protein